MPQPGREKKKILVTTAKFKKVSRENGISFHWLEPGKYLHIDGGRRWPRQDRGLWGGCVRNHMRATG